MRWVWRVQAARVVPSMRVSRCLPRERVPSDRAAGQVDRGERRHPEVGAGEGAARQRPVERAGRCARPRRPQARSRLRPAEPRGVATKPASPQGRAQRGGAGAEQLLAVGLLDGQPARARRGGPRRPARGRRARAGITCQVVGPGEQGLAAALDVEGERAVDEHHHGAGLAAGPVAGDLRLPSASRAGRARAGRRRRGWRGRWPPARPRPAWRRRAPRRTCAAGRSPRTCRTGRRPAPPTK